ncbi:hypothetical protein L7F22_047066 [Adiantum nelumboides]|nr:hypothetical protein [Adiantum nelumboides]
MSQYNRADMSYLDAPILEAGLGFVRPGEGQAESFPCLAFHLNGCYEHPSMLSFVNHVADVIVLELNSREDIERQTQHCGQSLPHTLRWVTAMKESVDKKNKLISGGDIYIVDKTEQFLRCVLGKQQVELRGRPRHKQGVLEVLNSHFPPHQQLPSFAQQEAELCECDFTTAKQCLPLQASFCRG